MDALKRLQAETPVNKNTGQAAVNNTERAAAELNRLSFLYGHAAYGNAVPAGCDPEPVKKLWRYLSASENASAS